MRRALRITSVIAVVLAGLGLWQLASAGWIHGKALVAQRLIAASWQQARDGGPARRPWPWADMRPVARLSVPALGIDLFVLDAATPRALAFGPAHVGGTAAPAGRGNTVLVAHRDTHFAFLRRLAENDEIAVEGTNGSSARYRVREVTVLEAHEARLLDAADSAQLTLITCYPFDAVRPGSTLRYVVIAERVA
jgi:sortase A